MLETARSPRESRRAAVIDSYRSPSEWPRGCASRGIDGDAVASELRACPAVACTVRI